MDTKDKIQLCDLLWAIKKQDGSYEVMFHNGVNLGDIDRCIDGDFIYWPVMRGGFWKAAPLRAIADLLDYMNGRQTLNK